MAGATILGFLLAPYVLARKVSNRIDSSPSDDAEEENERHGLED